MRVLVTAVVTFIVTAVSIAGVGLWFVSRGGLRKSEPQLVRVARPERGDLTETVSAEGEVEPKTKVEISARVSARIDELPYDQGDEVSRGSVLVELDATDLRAALRSAEAHRAARAAQIEVEQARLAGQRAAIEGTRATLIQARRDLQRKRTLLESADVSQADVDLVESRVKELEARLESARRTLRASELNLEVLESNLEAAEAEVERARDALSYTTIASPLAGVVTRVHAEVGETVIPGTMNNPGTVIIEVADLSKMLLVAEVHERDVGRIEVGQRVQGKIHACPDEEFEGTVDTIALSADVAQQGGRYYETEILLKLDGRRVPCASTAEAEIETRYHRDVLRLPTQAILARRVDEVPLKIRENNPNLDADKTYTTVVYRIMDGKAVVTPVDVGPSDETHTVVLGGITETDHIIVGPYKVLEGLKHEQKVRDEREAEREKTRGAETDLQQATEP
ncbi:MAG: efflux RND transporter periplasmic adaptor subunit [Candidatus Brocadiia bacterium]